MLQSIHKVVVGFHTSVEHYSESLTAPLWCIHLSSHIPFSVNSADKAKLIGYLSKWKQGKMLIGCAMYVDASKLPSLLSKPLQEDNMDVVMCLQNILHAKKSLRSFIDVDPLEWPTVKLVRNRIADSEYQGTTLKHFNESVLKSCKDQALIDVSRLERLEWSDIKLLCGLLIFLDTQTWRSVATDDNNLESAESSPGDKSLTEVSGAVKLIANTFHELLEAVRVNLLVLQDQITEIMEYAWSYLSIETQMYHN